MRLLRFQPHSPEPATLETNRLIIRRPASQDYQAWACLRHESQAFLRPYEPTWAKDELTKSAFRTRLRRYDAEITAGRGLPWFIFDREAPKRLLGGLTINNIRRGAARTGTLGYWMGEPYAGKGYMSEAVNSVAENLFRQHGLHRIEAATVLDNLRSQRLLEKCGFQREGTARQYLKINGTWKDHFLFARLDGDTPVALAESGK